ncbi:hypothetical protein DKT77_06535 [Meridianimarinicoccus roseus]|uniref:Transporter n=1 Tax=Meridianimarinicoccus roseus TaxID=2072018 RepID=A0A2V2LDB1_9RHOB|nr:hypothetical protein [Meridianimarinicoccus roseus]PWR03508.1 hypothetical protein DKT77_06535 [Meridianimarinicoccus roseus]
MICRPALGTGVAIGALARCTIALCTLAGVAAAQAPGGGEAPRWVTGVNGLAARQQSASIDGGGDVAVTRYFGGLSVTRLGASGGSVGASIGAGGADYSFGGAVAAPWGDIRDRRVSFSLRAPLGQRGSVIVVPSLRESAENGAELSDGRTYGGFAAVFWRLSDSFTIGPGIGVFSRLERDRQIFPFLAIDWDITDRINLSTGQGVGATQGPGLSLSYAVTDALRVGVAGRIESAEFRLNDTGTAPGGVGAHDAFPLVATIGWQPNPGLSASAFAGMEYGGELTVRDAQGGLVSRRDYDSAPVFGGQVSLRF